MNDDFIDSTTELVREYATSTVFCEFRLEYIDMMCMFYGYDGLGGLPRI